MNGAEEGVGLGSATVGDEVEEATCGTASAARVDDDDDEGAGGDGAVRRFRLGRGAVAVGLR